MSNNGPNRSLKEIVDLASLKRISAEDLLRLNPDEVDLIRKTSRKMTKTGEVAFVCRSCHHPAYLQHDINKLPMWSHRPEAPKTCEWYTGEPLTEDEVNAKKFQGNQESELHRTLKQVIADILESDPITETDSVIVDKYLIGANGRRKPDVRATYHGKPIAIEVQLVTTLLPTIVDRAEFYQAESRHLIWVTFSLSETNFDNLKVAFRDIYYEHSKCLFSVDDETIKQSRKASRLYLRATWFRDGNATDKICSLDELTWPTNAPPFLYPLIPSKILDWRKDWIQMDQPSERKEKIKKLMLMRFQETIDTEDDGYWTISEAISTFLSVVLGRPIHSQQTNLIEKLNTFLSTTRHYAYANMFKHSVRFSMHRELLDKKSLKQKILNAETSAQHPDHSIEAQIITKLFPEWF